MKIAIVGAGWAGMAAAVTAVQAGHDAIVFEAARAVGGRARALLCTLPDGTEATLDNGQHILIGAYTDTLQMMRAVGLDPERVMLRQALSLPFPDGKGLQTPLWAARWPAPLDALAAIATAKGWTWRDKASLMRHAMAWQLRGFKCAPLLSVADLCQGMAPRVFQELIEPLCVSALNTPAQASSAQVLLRVLKDAMFGVRGGSNLLLPRVDLGALFPSQAQQWLAQRADAPGQSSPAGNAIVRCGHRVTRLEWQAPHWLVDGEAFDRVIWATSASEAARAQVESAKDAPESIAEAMTAWAAVADALHFEAITTVYAMAPGIRLPHAMLALHNTPESPAQFVFDRGQLGGPEGLLAFIVSASQGTRESLQIAVLAQARAQLGHLIAKPLQAVQTVIEKRATFACTPGLLRPAQRIAPSLVAAGDYVEGPYPATLEGAIRSGVSAVACLD